MFLLNQAPSRERLLSKVKEANAGIRKFLAKQPNTSFADVFHKMIRKDGQINAGLFLEDNLHMNKSGYAIWQSTIKPFLLKVKQTTMKRIVLLISLFTATQVLAQNKPVAADAKMNLFISNLMKKMTLDEKIGQLNLPGSGDIVTGQASNSNVQRR